MNAAIAYLPNRDEACARITARQREANIAAEGQPVDLYNARDGEVIEAYRNYRTALAVVEFPHWYNDQLVRDAQVFIHAYESATPKGHAMNPGPMPRQLCAADQAQIAIRRACVNGYQPDRPRPRDMGFAAICAVLVLSGVVGLLVGYAAQHGWL